MNVLHCISGLSSGSGGPARSVPALADALARRGPAVRLAYVSGPDDVDLDGCAAVPAPYQPSPPRSLGASRELRRALKDGPGYDIYHASGLWELAQHYTSRAALQHDAPFVITPRGMLEPWALKQSSWKKQLARRLYAGRTLERADCLHAITTSEVASFRAFGLDAPVAVVPNGVDLEEFEGLDAARDRLADLYPTERGRPVALFLSRLHPKKGLLHLMTAWAAVRADHADWVLLVCGPDDIGYRSEVEQRADRLGLGESVIFAGPVYGADKLAALAAAECFVLPSFSEGFSMAVLEALACRLPVLITPGCNFPEVEDAGAGIVVAPNAAGTEEGLRRLLTLDPAERATMGGRGRRLVEEQYTWDRIADTMMEVYQWLIDGGTPPECVVTD